MPPESQHEQATVVFVLECVECGARDARAEGWQAYPSPETGLLIYCAQCAEREFGD